jgi:hypothetical protein
MSTHREALEEIMDLCARSRTYTRRTMLINETAMKALGMTANQRHAKHMAILHRIGDVPAKEAYLQREAKRQAKAAVQASTVLHAAAQHEDAHGAFHLDGPQ